MDIRLRLAGASALAAIGMFSPVTYGSKLLVSGSLGDHILRYDAQTGAPHDLFTSKAFSDVDYVLDMAMGPDGRVYVASYDNDSIRCFDATSGDMMSIFIPSGSGGLDGPTSMMFHDGSLFV